MTSQVLGAETVAEEAWFGRAVPRRLRYVVGLGMLVGLYVGSAHIGFAFQFAGPVAAIVWLPVGVAISFLYLGGL